MQIITSIGQALFTSFSMFWEILWPLILGFTLSGIVQAVVSHQAMAKALGGDRPVNLTLATLFGIASSSCSYAAVALARSIFLKGANGGARRNGYECFGRLIFLAAVQSEGVDGGQQLLCDGLGVGVGRYPARAAHRRGISGVGSQLVLERVFLLQQSHHRQN